jgi:hypothetical protein
VDKTPGLALGFEGYPVENYYEATLSNREDFCLVPLE